MVAENHMRTFMANVLPSFSIFWHRSSNGANLNIVCAHMRYVRIAFAISCSCKNKHNRVNARQWEKRYGLYHIMRLENACDHSLHYWTRAWRHRNSYAHPNLTFRPLKSFFTYHSYFRLCNSARTSPNTIMLPQKLRWKLSNTQKHLVVQSWVPGPMSYVDSYWIEMMTGIRVELNALCSALENLPHLMHLHAVFTVRTSGNSLLLWGGLRHLHNEHSVVPNTTRTLGQTAIPPSQRNAHRSRWTSLSRMLEAAPGCRASLTADLRLWILVRATRHASASRRDHPCPLSRLQRHT